MLHIYVFYSQITCTTIPNHVTKSTLEIKIAKITTPSCIFQIVNGSNNYSGVLLEHIIIKIMYHREGKSMPPIKRYMRLGGGKQQPLVTNLVQHAASFDKNMHIGSLFYFEIQR